MEYCRKCKQVIGNGQAYIGAGQETIHYLCYINSIPELIELPKESANKLGDYLAPLWMHNKEAWMQDVLIALGRATISL